MAHPHQTSESISRSYRVIRFYLFFPSEVFKVSKLVTFGNFRVDSRRCRFLLTRAHALPPSYFVYCSLASVASLFHIYMCVALSQCR